jgi:hypothetical protein
MDVIPTPRLSSIIFMVHDVDIDSFKVQFAYGMQYVACTASNHVQWHNMLQTLLYKIIEESLQLHVSLKGLSETEE